MHCQSPLQVQEVAIYMIYQRQLYKHCLIRTAGSREFVPNFLAYLYLEIYSCTHGIIDHFQMSSHSNRGVNYCE